MERTTISLPPQLLQRLRVIAAERRVSMASIIREAVEEKADKHRPMPRSIGIFDSGRTDIAKSSADLKLEPPEWRSS